MSSTTLADSSVKACPEVAYILDLDSGRLDFIGGSARNLLGYESADSGKMSGRSFAALIHPDDRVHMLGHFERLKDLPDNTSDTLTFRFVDAAGESYPFAAREFPFLRTPCGRVRKVLAVATRVDVSLLQDTNTPLKTIFANASDCYVALDCNLIVTEINADALHWFGVSREQVVGAAHIGSLRKLPVPESALIQALQRREPMHIDVPSGVQPGRWMSFHVYPSDEGYSIFFRDVSDRRFAEPERESAQNLLDTTLNALSTGVVILDQIGTILRGNEPWSDMLRQSGRRVPAGGVGENYETLCPLRPKSANDRRKFDAGLRQILDGSSSELRLTYRADLGGQRRWYKVHAARFEIARETRIVIAHDDVTETHEAERSRHGLSKKLLHLQEEERRRIAAELHDSTSQHLTAIGLNLMNLRCQFAPTSDVADLLDDLDNSVEQAQREIRAFTYLLHPPYLARDGLKSTLERYIEGFSIRTHLKSAVAIDGEVDTLSIELQRTVLRIVQESLTNVYRHAAAKLVRVDLVLNVGDLCIRIQDNGKGIVYARQRRDPESWLLGVGIPGMRARLRQFGGSLELSSTLSGTTVIGTVPAALAHARPVRRSKPRRTLRLVKARKEPGV